MNENITASDVLHRYKDEDLPEFSEIALDDINQVGNFGNQPIHVASVRGNPAEVLALLEGGANVNAIGELGNRPLHDAVGQGHIEIVKLLLNAGALLTEKNDFEMTPLDIASTKGNKNIVNLLRLAK